MVPSVFAVAIIPSSIHVQAFSKGHWAKTLAAAEEEVEAGKSMTVMMFVGNVSQLLETE
jgi:hypothetical protein